MKLYFRKYGSGPPLIILHGLYGSSDNWITIARAISNSFSVILPDLRNHGHSPHSDVHDYDSMSNDIAELADDLKIDRFFLAGHSMGGKAAAAYALKWPERLHGLLFADIAPFRDVLNSTEQDKHLTIIKSMLSVNLEGVKSRSAVESLLSSRIKSERTVGMIMKNLQREPDNTFSWKINVPSLMKNMEKIMAGISLSGFNGNPLTGFPVLLLRGENSDYVTDADFQKVLEIFPSAELIMIPHAGHWINSDNPAAVRDSFLRLIDAI